MLTAEMTSAEDLVRVLLKCRPAGNEIENDRRDSSVEEIIFDLEIDGARYLVIRLPKSTQVPVALSPREREIVRLVALGHSNKIIADVLNISSWTVCTHLRRIFAKLGVGSRAAMVAHLSEIGRTGIADRIGPKGDACDAGAPARCSDPKPTRSTDSLHRAWV